MLNPALNIPAVLKYIKTFVTKILHLNFTSKNLSKDKSLILTDLNDSD